MFRENVSVRPYHVYIGKACTCMNRRFVEEPAFSVPSMCKRESARDTYNAFSAYAEAKFARDRGWASRVRSLRGKTMACWCVRDAEWCHGHVLHSLSNQ